MILHCLFYNSYLQPKNATCFSNIVENLDQTILKQYIISCYKFKQVLTYLLPYMFTYSVSYVITKMSLKGHYRNACTFVYL